MVVVPVSLIGTFGAMYLLGYSLDNFSLMALTIATGFVVDDAIVVMENTIAPHRGRHAALAGGAQGAREVGFTVLSMSLSLIAVFIPFLLMRRHRRPAVSRVHRDPLVAILISLVVSLTTTPMMCALLLRPSPADACAWLRRRFERAFEPLRGAYERSLDWALEHPRTMMFTLLAAIVLNICLYVVIPKGFFPAAGHRPARGAASAAMPPPRFS